MTTETATWCATRNGYAQPETCSDPPLHVHYDVEYDVATGRTLTSREEQERRRVAASPDRVLWIEVARTATHGPGGALYQTADRIKESPAMIELLRRARAGA